jgi:uncharacterized membrane protein SpoIIM required for sporulation
VSLVIALESFVGEKERHSLEPLLSSPLTDTQLYVGKTLAAMLPPLLAAYLGITVYLVGLAVTIQWYPNPTLLIQILALTTIQALVMVAGAVVISAQTTSVRAANLLASFIIIPMAILVQGESLIMFWAQYGALWWVIVGLAVITVILIRLGVRLFNREELLGKDLDEINLRTAWRTFAAGFVGAGRGRGVGGWYRREVWPAVRRLRLPAALVAGVLVAAILIGLRYASIYQLPLKTAGLAGVRENFSNSLAQLGFVSVGGAAWVFFTNLRALAAAALLGVFSFGVLGVVLLMVSLALTGYFAGQVALIGLSPLQFFGAFILPHGVFEITAAVLTGAAILRLGSLLLAPPANRTLGESFLAGLADFAKVAVAVVVPLLLVAAAVEVFVTPLVVAQVLGA